MHLYSSKGEFREQVTSKCLSYKQIEIFAESQSARSHRRLGPAVVEEQEAMKSGSQWHGNMYHQLRENQPKTFVGMSYLLSNFIG